MQDDSKKHAKKRPGNWLDDWLDETGAAPAEANVRADTDLFKAAMQNVTPIQPDNKVRPTPRRKKIRIRSLESSTDIDDVFSDAPVDECPDQLLYSQDGLTPDTLKKLRQGKFHIDHSIDLHGMTVNAARDYLLDFLAECAADGSRCIIIVHGKGYSSPDKKPVIKPLVNRWLRATPMVLAFCSALPKDGGTGAAYVLLKRNK